MALLSLPSIAKITELRLRIAVPISDPTLTLNRRKPIGPAYREMWMADVALAAVSPQNMPALIAAFERMDGRVAGFKIPLGAGKFSRAAAYTASLVAAPATGADRIRLNLSPASGALLRGTLITLGDIEASDFQLVEVVKTVTASSDTTVRIAPRIRRKFTTGSAVALGNVTGRFKLSTDQLSDSVSVSSGSFSFSAMEAP